MGKGHALAGNECRCRGGDLSSNRSGNEPGAMGVAQPARPARKGAGALVGVHAAAFKGSLTKALTICAHVSTLVLTLPFSMRQIVV